MCVSVQHCVCGRFTPSSSHNILPLVLYPFQGGTPVTGPGPLPGVCVCVWGGGGYRLCRGYVLPYRLHTQDSCIITDKDKEHKSFSGTKDTLFLSSGDFTLGFKGWSPYLYASTQ